MSLYYLSIGSNIESEKHIPEAVRLLRETFSVKKISSVYETPPFGSAEGDNFWNLVLCLETETEADDLRRQLAEIEKKLGRVKGLNKYAPRTIDLDLLPKLEYQKQAFVVVPFAEIAPELRDPESDKTIGELAASLRGEADAFKKISSLRV